MRLWLYGVLGVVSVALLTWGYVVDTRRHEARLAMVNVRSVPEVERQLGRPTGEWSKLDDIHRDCSRDIYTEADEQAGLVLKRYVLWSEVLSFHFGYLELIVKVRPSDGAVLAAKVFHS